MENQVLHTVWCNISGEAAGDIWNWSLLGVEGLRYSTLLTTKRAVLLIVAVWLASFVPHLLLYLTCAEKDPAGPPRAFDFFDIVVFEISPIIVLPCLAGRIFVIVRRQERRMKTQMRQVRFNRQAEPGSEISSHNRRTSTMKFICAAIAVFEFCYANRWTWWSTSEDPHILGCINVALLCKLGHEPIGVRTLQERYQEKPEKNGAPQQTVMTWAKARATNMEMNNFNSGSKIEK